MRWIIGILIISTLTSYTFILAQPTFNCAKTIATYQKTYPEEKIINTSNFCAGAEEAYQAIELGLKWHVNQFEISPCTLNSFERHRIKIIGTGTTKLEAVVDENKGYNFIMEQRIIKHIGQDAFDNLGKEDSGYFSLQDFFDGNFQKELNKTLILKETLMGNIKLKLDKDQTDFAKYVSQMKVLDVHTNKVFFFGDLYSSVCLDITPKDEAKKHKELQFFLTSVKDPKFCKYKTMPEIRTIRVSLEDYFGRWAEEF